MLCPSGRLTLAKVISLVLLLDSSVLLTTLETETADRLLDLIHGALILIIFFDVLIKVGCLVDDGGAVGGVQLGCEMLVGRSQPKLCRPLVPYLASKPFRRVVVVTSAIEGVGIPVGFAIVASDKTGSVNTVVSF